MFERIEREDVLRVVKQHGPIIPLDIKRKLGKGETTMIGAVLSELAHHKRVAITHLKRGSSPFYYDPNNPASLENVGQYLGEKDRRTFDLLKEKRSLDTTTLEPLTRVSLGNIPDFSRSFHHVINGENRLCYRYFLTSEDDARKMLGEKETDVEPEVRPQVVEKSAQVARQSESKKVVEGSEEAQSMQKQSSSNTSPKSEEPKKAKPIKKKSKERDKTLSESFSNEIKTDDAFLKRIVRYCNAKNLIIQENEIVRKEQEIDLVLLIPTPVGKMQYYCKAKSKKKSNDGDVASALLAGQMRRLPTIYLTTGEVTKKAKEMTQKELKGVLIKEIKP